MQQLFNVLALLPGYLVFLAIFLVILPTLVTILLRYCLYRHLAWLVGKATKLLGGVKLESTPKLITKLEQRFLESPDNREQINTAAVIEGMYSQERFYFLGATLNCEFIDNLCRILPNLLLSFGLLGTFLGITFNLANLSQTITQVDISDVRNLIEELDAPLQGMGIAFLTSLIAIACSSLLTVINLTWNTNIAKSTLLSIVEDYIDNVYLPEIQPISSMEGAINKFSSDFDTMLNRLGDTIEQVMTNAFIRIENSAKTFEQAANIFDNSRFPEKLAAATNNLAIAQNQFSQSSLILQRSTESFEHNLDSMQKLTKKFIEVNYQVKEINHKYTSLVHLYQEKNIIEKSSLEAIKQELARLVEQMQQM